MPESIELKSLIKTAEATLSRRIAKKEPKNSFTETFFSHFEKKFKRISSQK